jgi:hypothetical protein
VIDSVLQQMIITEKLDSLLVLFRGEGVNPTQNNYIVSSFYF